MLRQSCEMLAQDYGSQLEVLPISDEYSVGIESMRYSHLVIDQNQHTFKRQTTVIFLYINFNICLGCSEEPTY